MPELPEIRTTAYYLNKALQGQKIINVIVYVPKMIKEILPKQFISSLKGKNILTVNNVAKFLVFHLNNDIIMLSHLRMEGKYRIDKKFIKGSNDCIIFQLENKVLVYSDTRKFGTFHIKNKNNYLNSLPLKKLGPEPSEKVLEEIYNKIYKKRVAIKTVLLDQTIVAGLGNIYVNEVLWKTKINPTIHSNQISKKQLKQLLINSEQIMNKATLEGGSTIQSYLSFNTTKGGYQRFLEVYGKEKQNCSRCKTQIQKIKVNGRGTHYCPMCQNLKV